MESKFSTRWVVALFVFCLIVGGIVISRTHATNHNKTLKAVLSGSLELPLVPENISTIPLYQIHANLWGTLLRDHGKEGLARIASRSEDGKHLILQLLPNVSFSNGRKIKAEDIVFSINRLISRQNRGHFNVRGVIKNISAISESSVAIELAQPAPAVVFLLSIPETGLVPKEICDTAGNIVALNVTSGAYRIETVPGPDSLTLVKNPAFQNHIENSPELVNVIFRRGSESLVRAFESESADFMEFYESAGMKALKTLQANSQTEIVATKPSYSTFAVNHSKRMSGPEKKALARLIGEKITYVPTPGLEEKSYELLPPRTFGTLGAMEPVVVPANYMEHLPKTVLLREPTASSPLFDSLRETLSGAGIAVQIIADRNATFDIEVRGQGMNSDFPEIEFFLNMASPYAFIPASVPEKLFIEEMLHTTNSKERFAKVQRLGNEILNDGRVVPLILRSYVHLFRKGVIEEASKTTDYDGDVLFYRMRLAP